MAIINVDLKSNISKNHGFTIVELLVTVVIIGILASITLVSYTGVTNRANQAVLQSDLSNARTKLAIYQAENGSYPTALDDNNCPSSPKLDTNYCLKPSNNTTFEYKPVSAVDFNLRATKGDLTYIVTANSNPTDDAANWITLGNQRWANTNLNIGTMVTSAAAQTNNLILEKYCPNNIEANCTSNGALYQWDEAMNYITTEGSRGICPANSHIPSDNDWKILEMQLGMTQEQADALDIWRGTDQGTQLKSNGSSGLNLPLASYRNSSGTFSGTSSAYLWSSTQSTTSAWNRYLRSDYTTVNRSKYTKTNGFSIRCLGN